MNKQIGTKQDVINMIKSGSEYYSKEIKSCKRNVSNLYSIIKCRF